MFFIQRNRPPDPNLLWGVTGAQQPCGSGVSPRKVNRWKVSSEDLPPEAGTYCGMIRRTIDRKRDGPQLFWRNRHGKRGIRK